MFNLYNIANSNENLLQLFHTIAMPFNVANYLSTEPTYKY